MEFYIVGGIIVVFILTTVIRHKLNPPVPVPLNELPPNILKEYQELESFECVEDPMFSKLGKSYRFKGMYAGVKKELVVELDPQGLVKEVELEPIGNWSKSFGSEIPEGDLPAQIGALMFKLVGSEANSFQLTRVKKGTANSTPAFEVKGLSTTWEWEFCALESGELFEFEKERPKR